MSERIDISRFVLRFAVVSTLLLGAAATSSFVACASARDSKGAAIDAAVATCDSTTCVQPDAGVESDAEVADVRTCTGWLDAGTSVTVLAIDQANTGSVAVDDDDVYWITSDGTTSRVMRCAKRGCGGSPTIVASSGTQWQSPLVVDATSVYWSDFDSVLTCAKSGCGGNPTILATGQGCAGQFCTRRLRGIAVDESNVYWLTLENPGIGTVMKCAKSGCGGNPTVVGSSPNMLEGPSLATDGVRVYWTAHSEPIYDLDGAAILVPEGGVADEILMCSTAGCGGNPTSMARGIGPIAVDGTNVFFTSSPNGPVVRCPAGGCGGAPSTVAEAVSGNVGSLSVSGSTLWWTTAEYLGPNPTTLRADYAISLLACATAACQTSTKSFLAEHASGPLSGLGADCSGVYWTGQYSADAAPWTRAAVAELHP